MTLCALTFCTPALAAGSSESKEINSQKLESIVADLKALMKTKPTGPGYSYGILVDTLSPFWTATALGAQIAAGELEVSSSFTAPAGGASAELQRQYFKMMSEDIYQGFSLSVIDKENLKSTAMQVRAARKLGVVAIDSDAPREMRDYFIATDNYRAGVEAGKAMIRALGKKGGKVIIAVGNGNAPNAQERIQGIHDAFKGTSVTAVGTLADNNSGAVAEQKLRERLKAEPDIVGIIAVFSFNGPAALRILKEMDLQGKVKIVAFDIAKETMDGLKNGTVSAAIAQRPYYWGRLSVYILHAMRVAGVEETKKVLAKYASGENKDFIDTGIDVVTPEKVKAFQAQSPRVFR